MENVSRSCANGEELNMVDGDAQVSDGGLVGSTESILAIISNCPLKRIRTCGGTLNPTFCNNVIELVRMYSPAILILTETKASGERAKRIADRLPFDGAIFDNIIGLSGGLWPLWDSSQVDIDEQSSTEQEIHAMVTPKYSSSSWLLFAIYANPRLAERHLLWENLMAVFELHSFPWVIAGDYNEVLIGEDKYGGRPVNINRALRFQDCLDTCRMIDIGFSGTRFT
ncbi:uncharacterized protein LOC142639911 [Castanea sativa]|uniref:uncharacterized protein LOC142639911 n=1 Tax=Castanea sativa TaxID=21020 RepID=UPI003F650F0C